LNLVRRGIEDTFHIGSPLDDRRERDPAAEIGPNNRS
jgi:hypothetical protein